MPDKLDYKKAYPRFYAPGLKPERVLVPPMPFLMVDGRGARKAPPIRPLCRPCTR